MEIGNLVARIIEAIAWPVILVVFIFLFRPQIVRILERLSKIKYKDLEVVFDEKLKDAEFIAKEINIPQPEVIRSTIEPVIQTSLYDSLNEIAAHSPRAAVTEAWLNIEAASQEAASALEMEPRKRRSGREVIDFLVQQNKLPASAIRLYRTLRETRNMATHTLEWEMDSEEATRYIDLALGFVYHIRTSFDKPT